MVADFQEQYSAVKCCFVLGKSVKDTIVILKTAYGEGIQESIGGLYVFNIDKCQLNQSRSG